MKTLKIPSIFLLLAALFFSCQKEKILERVIPSTALGTLGVSAGACTPVTIAGSFTQGVPLTTTNTAATVQVTVTTIGAYTISTNTVNGV
ncbi:MAG: hypothetical protein ACR2KX_00120, partial [Chitinophagaceae bacterium]